MSFRIKDHDVTCLCALVALPARVIVEELRPEAGRARFQVQGCVSGHVGGLLEWMEPVLGGARVRRWEEAMAMARIEGPEGDGADSIRAAVRTLAAAQDRDLYVAVSLLAPNASPRVRLANLVRALEV